MRTPEELAVDPFALPSAILAGLSSLVAFSLGALVPLLAAALGIAAVALVAGRTVVGWLTDRPVLPRLAREPK